MALDPVSSRRPRRSSGGGFWLGLALVVGGVGAVYVFAPQLPRRLLGQIERPADGDAPTAAQSSATTLEERDLTTANTLTEVSQVARTETAQAPVIVKPTPTAPIQPISDKDEVRAQQLLGEANAAYQAAITAKDWSKATSAARKVLSLHAKPATLVRAKDIIRGAESLERLFKDLDDRDELARNFDTHPSLVTYWDDRGSTGVAVPIRSMDDKTPVEGDPLAWIAGQRKSGKLTMMLRGSRQFSPGVLTSDQIQKVERADVAAVIAERRKQFDERLARLKNGNLAGNPLAWYDAAKFAYQNRLDDHVSQMMDRALLLDPFLAQSVREDKAAGLFSNVVLHLTNKNSAQAAAFMAVIDKKFGDTPSGKEARAFYDAKTKSNAAEIASAQAALRAARREGAERAAEEARKRKAQRLARALETGDASEIAAAKAEPTSPGDDFDAMAPASGDEGKADELYAKGKELYQKAIEAGNSDGRDQLYEQSNKYLSQAQNLYNTLLEKTPGNPSLEEKAFMCNKLRYGSIKQRRFH